MRACVSIKYMVKIVGRQSKLAMALQEVPIEKVALKLRILRYLLENLYEESLGYVFQNPT